MRKLGLLLLASLLLYSPAEATTTFTISATGTWSPVSAVVAAGEVIQLNGDAGSHQPIFIVGLSGQRSPGDPVMYNAVTPYTTVATYSGYVCWNMAAVEGSWRCATITVS